MIIVVSLPLNGINLIANLTVLAAALEVILLRQQLTHNSETYSDLPDLISVSDTLSDDPDL